MAKFEHTQGLDYVEFDKTISMYCPLGKEPYTAKVGVSFEPGQYMMDYLDMEAFFKKVQGSNLIIEDLVETVYNHLDEEYAPKWMMVTVEATNAAHFPVKVAKSKRTILELK